MSNSGENILDVSAIADLYDRFANAEDPFSEDAREAESAFFAKLHELHAAACRLPSGVH